MEKPKPPKPKDRYFHIKYKGYCLSQMPDGKISFEDFVNYAKFQLCVKNRVLFKSAVWDDYTSEEILIEFFGHQYQVNEKLREEFEVQIHERTGKGPEGLEDFLKWADKQMAEEQKVQKQLLGETEDSLSFDPSSVIGE